MARPVSIVQALAGMFRIAGAFWGLFVLSAYSIIPIRSKRFQILNREQFVILLLLRAHEPALLLIRRRQKRTVTFFLPLFSFALGVRSSKLEEAPRART